MRGTVARTALLMFAIACALAASQFPSFRQQYLQRLGGTLDELDRQIVALDERAAAADMARYAYIRRLMGNEDPVVRREAEALVALLGRRQRLMDARAAIAGAPLWAQAAQVVFHLDTRIAERTLTQFVPSLPLSLSGAFHAFIGFFLGFFAPLGVRQLLPHRVRLEA